MTIIAIFLALLPVLVMLFHIVVIQDHDPEPPRTVGFAFVWGCLMVIPAIWSERAIVIENDFLNAMFGIAIIEEALKLAVLMIYIWKHKDFNDSFDAMVYAVVVSLGFAAVENVMYVIKGGIQVAIARDIISVPGHANNGIVMGFFFAKAKTYFYHNRRGKQYMYLVLALLAPTFLHGMFDYFCVISRDWVITQTIVQDIFCLALMSMATRMDKPLEQNDK